MRYQVIPNQNDSATNRGCSSLVVRHLTKHQNGSAVSNPRAGERASGLPAECGDTMGEISAALEKAPGAGGHNRKGSSHQREERTKAENLRAAVGASRGRLGPFPGHVGGPGRRGPAWRRWCGRGAIWGRSGRQGAGQC